MGLGESGRGVRGKGPSREMSTPPRVKLRAARKRDQSCSHLSSLSVYESSTGQLAAAGQALAAAAAACEAMESVVSPRGKACNSRAPHALLSTETHPPHTLLCAG